MQNNKYPYQKEWKEYRKRRNVSFLTLFSAIAIFVLTGLFCSFVGINIKENFALQFVIFSVWAIIYWYNLSKFYNWKCPRCDERFFVRSFWITNPIFSSECRNCGLPKYDGSTFQQRSRT